MSKYQNTKYNFKNIEFDISNEKVNFNSFVYQFLKKSRIRKGFISVLVNIKQIDGQYYSVGNRFPLDISNKEAITAYIEFLESKYAMLEERYKVVQPLSIFFNFTKIDDASYKRSKTLFYGQTKALGASNLIDFANERPANLPLNTNYITWGPVERLGSNTLKIKHALVDLPNSTNNNIIHVTLLNKFNKVIEVYTSSNILVSKIIDHFIDPYGNEFIRQVGDKSYHIKDNKVYFIFDNLYLDYKSITKARLAKKFSINMLTLDIETFFNEDKSMSIYCISMFDGVKSYSYFLTDYESIADLVEALFKKLFSREYAQKTVYIHNSSNFDLIFLLKYIVNKEGFLVEPTIKDGSFINLRVKYGPNFNYYINFKDSFLILPNNLNNLTSDFNVETLKGAFPHEFVKATNLNYIGDVPDLAYFNNTNMNSRDYDLYILNYNNNWNLKKEAIKYCERDCIALYQVMLTFSNLIFKEFNINVSSISTLPSLAFKIFRTNFLSKAIKLPVITGKIYNDISKAYYGGHCDMYIPINKNNEFVFEYDCNSMFPFVMKEFKYPGKILGYFRGNILAMEQYAKLFHDNLGFFKVKITAPKDLNNPILANKFENVSIYGVGTWTGWYFSEELKNAIKYGYKFEIIEGYIFEPTTVFIDYVNSIFKIKYTAATNSPMYTIAKLLLNTLYGRFGLSPNQLTHEVISNKEINQRINEIGLDNLQNIISFGNKSIVSYSKSFSRIPLINVGIAAAISAYARIYMSQFKNNPKFTLYYTDTDSIFINKPLPSFLVDEKELGKFKTVNVFRKFIGLAPKVYGGINNDGHEVIKAKGLKLRISFAELEKLLNVKALSNESKVSLITQPKWFKNLEDGTITEKEILHNLKPTENKRNLIYSNNLLIGTSNKEFKE